MRALRIFTTLGLAGVSLFGGGEAAAEYVPNLYLPLDDPDIELAPPYLGLYDMGLYARSNQMPEAHYLEGIERANQIVPLDNNGNPDPVNGRIVVMSLGMSNTSAEWCNLESFIPVHLNMAGVVDCQGYTAVGRTRNPGAVNAVNPLVQPLHGAMPAQVAFVWVNNNLPVFNAFPANPNIPQFTGNYSRIQLHVMPYYTPPITEAQVQVIWLKQLNPAPQPNQRLPDPSADAFLLETHMGNIVRFAKTRYPNLKMVFFTSAAYRGYNTNGFGPEPQGYETGFAVKFLIDAQIAQMASGGTYVDPIAGDLDYDDETAPWLAWGVYWYANGYDSRHSDGLSYEPGEFGDDRVHFEQPGYSKAGLMLLHFFTFSPFTHCWFVGEGTCG